MRPHSIARNVAAAATALFITACDRGPIIQVINRSDVELREVVLSGSGFSERVTSLPAAGHHSFSPSVRGESSLSVTFAAAGVHHESAQDTYFEGGESYFVVVTIDPQMKVTTDAKLK